MAGSTFGEQVTDENSTAQDLFSNAATLKRKLRHVFPFQNSIGDVERAPELLQGLRQE